VSADSTVNSITGLATMTIQNVAAEAREGGKPSEDHAGG
jgi:hypothetical protein